MDIKDLLSGFSFKTAARIFSYAAAFVALLLLVLYFINVAAERRYYSEAPLEEESDDDLPFFTPDAADLKIPLEYTKEPEFTWQQYRKVPEKWSDEEIDRFWKDPADVIIDVYSDECTREIGTIFENVP